MPKGTWYCTVTPFSVGFCGSTHRQVKPGQTSSAAEPGWPALSTSTKSPNAGDASKELASCAVRSEQGSLRVLIRLSSAHVGPVVAPWTISRQALTPAVVVRGGLVAAVVV